MEENDNQISKTHGNTRLLLLAFRELCYGKHVFEDVKINRALQHRGIKMKTIILLSEKHHMQQNFHWKISI